MLKEKLKIVSWNLANAVSFENNKKLIFRKEILQNIVNQIKVLKDINADFMLLQEITRLSLANMFTNPLESFKTHFEEYAMGYVSNTNLSKLLDHGNATLSNCNCQNKDIIFQEKLNNIVNNLIFSNRGSIMTEIQLEKTSSKLVIFNIHFAPFKLNNEYRNKQMKYILKFAKKELEKGNYVIIGGDFNIEFSNIKKSTDILNNYRDLINSNDWYVPFTSDQTFKQHSIIKRPDGFITSSNIDINDIFVVKDYKYSDHNPVVLKFKLK